MKLMTHVVVGYPSLDATVELVKVMVASGVDMVELQIPFSDPLADGPTIMKACEESLKNGTKVKDVFRVMRELSDYFSCHPELVSGSFNGFEKMPKRVRHDNTSLLFMCYYNTVFNYGVEKFINDAKEAGCGGLIVPDIPLEEEKNEHFYSLCKKYKLPVIFVVSPVTPDSRLAKIAHSVNSGQASFVYATARQGTTGIKNQESRIKNQELITFLKRVKKYFSIPIAVGFGISTREQVQSFQGYADIAVVGSALIEVINSSKDMKKGVDDFLVSLSS